MTAKSEARYFKIGLFVLIGIVLLISFLILLSTSGSWRKPFYVETYFNESVQGLSVGSNVKYRGMTVGHVKEIDFVGNKYSLNPTIENAKYNRYIYVLMSINPSFFHGFTTQERVQKNLKYAVETGLRVKMALQDLTGGVYLEINFTNPKQNPVLPIVWEPDYPYIPSTPSTMAKFSENAQQILENLGQVDFKGFINQAQNLVDSTNQLVDRFNHFTASNQEELNMAMRNLQVATQDLRQMTDSLKQNPSQILFDKPKPLDPKSL